MRSLAKPSALRNMSELEQCVLCLANEPPSSLRHLDPCTPKFWRKLRVLPDWKDELGRESPQALVKCLLRARGDDDDCIVEDDDEEWKPSGDMDEAEAPTTSKRTASDSPLVPTLKLKIQKLSAPASIPSGAGLVTALDAAHVKVQELQERSSQASQTLSAAQAEERQLREKLAKLHAEQMRNDQEARAARTEAKQHRSAVQKPMQSWEAIWRIAIHIMDGDPFAKKLAGHQRKSIDANARSSRAVQLAKRAAAEHTIQLAQLEKCQTHIGARQGALDTVQQELQSASAECAKLTEQLRTKTVLELILEN